MPSQYSLLDIITEVLGAIGSWGIRTHSHDSALDMLKFFEVFVILAYIFSEEIVVCEHFLPIKLLK